MRQTMQENGLPQKIVLHELKSRLRRDFTYDSGKILSSMCTSPHDFAKKVFSQNLEKNLGDPVLFPATAEIEQETLTRWDWLPFQLVEFCSETHPT